VYSREVGKKEEREGKEEKEGHATHV